MSNRVFTSPVKIFLACTENLGVSVPSHIQTPHIRRGKKSYKKPTQSLE